MKQIKLIDTTLTLAAAARKSALSFKEKLELSRCADRLCVDMIELPPVTGGKADLLLIKTVAAEIKTPVCAQIPAAQADPGEILDSIRCAAQPSADVVVPASPVKMEYEGHMKKDAMLAAIKKQLDACAEQGVKAQVTFEDATRAEPEFLTAALEIAIKSGAFAVTLCDTAGVSLPNEFAQFVRSMREAIPADAACELYVQASDEMSMAAACAAAAIEAGADGVKCTMIPAGCTTLSQMAQLLRVKGSTLAIEAGLRTTDLTRATERIERMLGSAKTENAARRAAQNDLPNVTLSLSDDISEVVKVVGQLGYDLSDEDNQKVYEAFRRIAAKKQFVGTRELDAIVASTAMQVPSSFRLESYVINSGNVLTATANIALTQNGETRRSVGVGDGPIDAAFLAIEQIVGYHYEMDDFQIQTVTEGREAMGSALVKLRANGKLYSGNGISTDVIGASIRAYISALNKILYEEA